MIIKEKMDFLEPVNRRKNSHLSAFFVSKEDAAGYCRRSAALLASGMALPEALLCAAEGTRRLTRAAARLKEAVLAGIPLSEAFSREKFPRTAVQLCLLAEESGKYPRGLTLAAEALEQETRERASRGSTLYPALMCAGLLLFFLLFAALVFPALEEAFSSLSIPLPPLTQAVASFGTWLLMSAAWLLPVIAALVLLFFAVSRLHAVRLRLDALRLRSRAERCKIAVRFCRMLPLLQEGGATLPEALTCSAALLPNARAALGIQRAAARLLSGEPLSRALAKEKLFPAFLIAAIAAGERSNSVASLLQSVLPALEREREAAIRRSSAVLRTLLLCLAAAELVLLFAALYAPILTLFASVL